MKRILVTGANSYIGTSFEKYVRLWPEDYQVCTIDMVDGSWRQKSFVGYDSVFHVAGIAHVSTKNYSEEQRKRYWSVNADLPVAVAKKAKAEGVGQFIFLSSVSVYGEEGSLSEAFIIKEDTSPNPKGIYGESKLAAERGLTELEDALFRVCIVRPPMIYGPGCKGNYQTLARFARKAPFFPEYPNQRSMLFVGNFSPFVAELVTNVASGIYHPQNTEYVCSSKMVQAVAAANGRQIRMTRMLNPIISAVKIPLIRKVFGSIVFSDLISTKCSTFDFATSIDLTEGGQNQ